MSDTPRTECYVLNPLPQVVSAEWARQLERELNAANDRIKRLEEFVDQLTNPKFTRDDLPKEALLQRIKRLEEALSFVTVDCGNLHHGKKHRHKYGEPCPVVELIEEAREAKP